MQIGYTFDYRANFLEAVDKIAALERAGVGVVAVAEVYGFDAVSQLGYLAARTQNATLMSSVMQQYTRTPTLTAMTAAGLDYVSGGRFVLGLGASGPQVIEGFHGVRYDAPIARSREIIEICRSVWRRETLQHEGRFYPIPLPADQGTGLGKPLKMITRPVRERIPVNLAAIGTKNVALAAEVAELWSPFLFQPERVNDVWGDALAKGNANRDPKLGALGIMAPVIVDVGDGDHSEAEAQAKSVIALYVGGMGARGQNFYHHLVTRYGFGDAANTIQDLFLTGKQREAAAAVPDELVHGISLIGSAGHVKERIESYRAAGVTILSISPAGPAATDPAIALKTVEQLAEWAA